MGSRDLIEAAAGGDPDAQGELLDQHLARLRAFVRLKMGRFLRSKESSADLVQSVCREVLEDLPRFEYRTEGSFRHWLFTRAERKIQKRGRFYRQQKRDAAREVAYDLGEDDAVLDGVRPLFTPSQHARAAEELDRLEDAFQALPDDYREVILLSRIVGLSHEEIAERMGRSRQAIWSLLSRALARLAVQVDQRRGE